MTKPVRLEPEAEEELAAAARWYEARRQGYAKKFLDEVEHATTRIQQKPGACALVRDMPVDLPVRRAFVHRFPYTVVFIELREELRVLAIAHDRRRPDYWRSRIRK